ncbi:hypothetical protein EST62_12415 [Chlorobaculum sp. 24CR]|uniref:hypothetical protein n=1 Tax=Chlorobaculum sp. 24CR TaxID=2508878 RepID=UPI00100A709C|nr:hypothetical protein [Chlorobaculum sp. 24CR]RXK80714.1 hypothetical protein EST62_12415 [Chlorobaculum sp. 24CR]
MAFIRVNDPDRIARDSISPNYSNSLLSKTLERHYLSNQVYDHFFLRSFKNSERWDFIEDFFLGADVDSLIDKYSGAEGNDVDIIENLKKKDLSVAKEFVDLGDDFNVHIFYPDSQRYYCLKDPLTIVDNNGTRTKKVSEWLSEDPIAFDAVRKSTPFYVNKDVFEILVSKLKAHHPEYVKNVLGLKVKIEFKGYSRRVKASVPYTTQPVEFYKWWCSNQENVIMTLEEKFKLFKKVYLLKPTVLKREHKDMIKKHKKSL